MTFQAGNKYGKGRPKKPEIEALRKAIKQVESQEGRKPLLEHFIEQAYDDKTVLIALMKKFLPDLKAVDTRMAIENGRPIFLPILTDNDSKLADTIRGQIDNAGLPSESEAAPGVEVPDGGQ